MQIIISILIVGLLWMIYDIVNAPAVDEDENFLLPTEGVEEDKPEIEKPAEEIRLNDENNTSKVNR